MKIVSLFAGVGCCGFLILLAPERAIAAGAPGLQLNDNGSFTAPGVDVLVYNNAYDGAFSDAKISSIELIHHDVRTATNGDVRLSATPGQWDPVPTLVGRQIDVAAQRVRVDLAYRELGFTFALEAQADGPAVLIRVLLEAPLPAALEGRAGFNLEFLPSAYGEKTYLADDRGGVFPLHPSSDMQLPAGVRSAREASAARDGRPALAEAVARVAQGEAGALTRWRLDPPPPEPAPLARGQSLVLAPEDPGQRVRIESRLGELRLYDGRNQANNGWFVVRTLVPAGKTGVVVEWRLSPHSIPDWTRSPVIAHSQLGYHPAQPKIAVIELDRNALAVAEAKVLRLLPDGSWREVLVGAPKPWGRYLRYQYARFDFSAVREPGLYALAYGATRTKPFRIAADVYDTAWFPSLDVYMPTAMDHMSVKEAYRVWHGDSHRDDALQAPPNYEHFDLYAMGPSTDTRFKPGEHIPGLAVGGWLDAGDFDVRTQTQYAVVRQLVDLYERFGPNRDETTIDQERRHVEMHSPDGVPDVLQQIEHGVLQLVAQFNAVGHAIGGIVEPVLSQYTHLGDAASKTDNFVYDPLLRPGETKGQRSGTFDDRWAFTTHTSALNYGSIAALAAASRVLGGYRPELTQECRTIAERVWDEEQQRPPATFQHGNTTGGPLEIEEFTAAVELLMATGTPKYAERIRSLWPRVSASKAFGAAVTAAVRVRSRMDAAYTDALRERLAQYVKDSAGGVTENPFGVPIWRGGWAGSGRVMGYAINHFAIHEAFPDLAGTDATFRGFDFILGCHPGSDVSFVSGVGTVSKRVAYGSNRADFGYIAGGVVPGVLVLQPDFPENKEDWPFLWGENEYVINQGPMFIYLAHAVRALAQAAAPVPNAP